MRAWCSLVAGLDFFRVGTVIGGTVVTGARAEVLYDAIEQLADDNSSISILSKAEAAVNTSKVVMALNSVRTALKVCAVAVVELRVQYRDPDLST
jgi:hypothetical protein